MYAFCTHSQKFDCSLKIFQTSEHQFAFVASLPRKCTTVAVELHTIANAITVDHLFGSAGFAAKRCAENDCLLHNTLHCWQTDHNKINFWSCLDADQLKPPSPYASAVQMQRCLIWQAVNPGHTTKFKFWNARTKKFSHKLNNAQKRLLTERKHTVKLLNAVLLQGQHFWQNVPHMTVEWHTAAHVQSWSTCCQKSCFCGKSSNRNWAFFESHFTQWSTESSFCQWQTACLMCVQSHAHLSSEPLHLWDLFPHAFQLLAP